MVSVSVSELLRLTYATAPSMDALQFVKEQLDSARFEPVLNMTPPLPSSHEQCVKVAPETVTAVSAVVSDITDPFPLSRVMFSNTFLPSNVIG